MNIFVIYVLMVVNTYKLKVLIKVNTIIGCKSRNNFLMRNFFDS